MQMPLGDLETSDPCLRNQKVQMEISWTDQVNELRVVVHLESVNPMLVQNSGASIPSPN